MKRIILMCLLFIITLPTWSTAAAIGPARVRFVQGDALFRTPDSDEWLQTTANTPLDEGDVIWCADNSKVEIQLPDGTIVRLDGGSQLDLLANEDGFIHLHLASGHLYLKTSQAFIDNSLQIDADDTTVLPSARTRLRIDMQPNNEEDVAITKGSAYVEGNGSRTKVRAGEQILLEEGHNEILPLNPADSWEQWNVARDREQSRSAKTETFLPDELRSYSGELEANGSWVNVPEYGSVWRPRVIASSDWAPYRTGRWIWRGDDYVWLSFESWGWAPYHFGRWAVVSGFGWCWVPPARGDVYWGPGNVGWYRTGNRVAWTPLAPNEPFHGHRDYGPRNINITKITINSNNITYKNRNQSGGFTVLQQKDFLRGRNTNQRTDRNISLAVSVGGPGIKPVRETRMPIIKQTPPRVAPPKIERRDTRDLRDKFPRVLPEVVTPRQQPQPVPARTAPPAATPGRMPQAREKQTSFPVSVPVERPVSPAKPPQQPPAQQREDRQQRAQQPQPAPLPQPAPKPAPQPAPVVSPATPQRGEQPRQAAAPVVNQSVPATVPVRLENRPTAPPVQVKTPQPQQAATPLRGEQQRRDPASKEVQQKKVWRVTTPDTAPEKEPRGADPRGNETKGSDPRGNEGRGRERR